MKKGIIAPQENLLKTALKRKKAKENGETLKESIVKNIRDGLMDTKKY